MSVREIVLWALFCLLIDVAAILIAATLGGRTVGMG